VIIKSYRHNGKPISYCTLISSEVHVETVKIEWKWAEPQGSEKASEREEKRKQRKRKHKRRGCPQRIGDSPLAVH